MANYALIGYYNGIDAVCNMDCTPDEIISGMLEGKGAFHESDDEYEETASYLKANLNGQYANGKDYIVVYDVACKFENVDVDDYDEDEFCNEFIDIYKKVS